MFNLNGLSSMSLNTNIFSLGAVMGTSCSQETIDSINARAGGGSFFNLAGDPFKERFQYYMQNVVEPVRQERYMLANTANALFKPDVIRPINSIASLEAGIPPCMHEAIVYYKPIRQLLEEERIDGFGIKPEDLDDKDPYEEPLKSGCVDIDSSTVDEDGSFTIDWYWSSTDPELTDGELEAIRETREFIDEFLENEDTNFMDFTDYPNLRA